jgi:hypothetical protein
MFSFGSGVLIGTPNTANPTPINFGLIQSCDLDVSQSVKELYGQYQFPVAIGAGQRKLTGKAKMARISGMALGSLFFGVVPSAGSTISQYGESHACPATPFTVLIAPPNTGTFVADLGVVNAATGLPLTEVTGTPTAGQYNVAPSTGTYLFSTADHTSGVTVLISYTYSVSAAGEKIAVANALIGPAVNFSANLFTADPTTGNQFSVWLYSCVASKLSFGTKLEDFTIPELDFSCFANAAGQVMQLNFGDAA